jgi:hypothetical protein
LRFSADPSTSSTFFGLALDNVSIATLAVPEPATWAMMIFGFGAAGVSMRARKQKSLATA